MGSSGSSTTNSIPIMEEKASNNKVSPLEDEKATEERIVHMANSLPKGQPTTTKEVWAWWIYMMAIEPISPAVLQLFLPLILDNLPLIVGHIAGAPGTACTTSTIEECVLFELGSWGVTGTTFSYAITALSVALQAIFFICFGALADYGANRKIFLLVATYTGALFCVATLLVRSSWAAIVAGALEVLITIAFGASLMLYNSFLPLLAESHPDTIDFRSDDPLEMARRREVVAHRLSTISFMLGYGSAVIILILCALYLRWVSQGMDALRYLTGFCGLVWALGAVYPLIALKPRSGRDLPAGTNILTFSACKTFHTIARCKQLPNAFRYLIAYFLFADGCNTIGLVAVLFARSVLKMPYENIIICVIIAPVAGVLGNLFFFTAQRFLRLSSKTMLLWILTGCVLMCGYGVLGIFTTTLGLHHDWEMYMMAAFYGFHIGAMQSFSRVIFSELVPPGEESEFFSLYAITDKGSSWMGPAMQAIVTQYLSEHRLGLVFLATMILASFPLLIWGFDPIKGKQQALNFSELVHPPPPTRSPLKEKEKSGLASPQPMTEK